MTEILKNVKIQIYCILNYFNFNLKFKLKLKIS